MYIIIVGGGNLGYYLAELLLDEGHDVVLIDKSQEVCEKISRKLDLVTQKGDATDPDVLKKAGIKECNALVSLTGLDETNMIVSLLAKGLGAKTVATRISKLHYEEETLKKLGIDIVIHPEAAAAGYIEELITKPEVLDLAFISRGQAEIMELVVKENSKIAGKKVREIEHPAGSTIIALYDKGNLTIPGPENVITPGEKILVLVKTESADKARKWFLK